ncbi:ArnT family glycosyltransferase [Anthocerotibacter panamensis]|uniref:ArnT family glycosyltransferase n=1 Tax=Anthocerotibacter panamensis TaxID=2857077 RepID=UPI001C4056A2|nr:glycosyltransferase family 39 protein [Anthocerotibacter panamensis]
MVIIQTERGAIHPILASIALLLLSGLLLLVHGGGQSLMGADEGYYAQMAREIYQSGQWLVPTFLGVPFFEKPPLLQWLMALSFHFGGVSDQSARLPSWVAGLLTVQLTYWLGRSWINGRVAFWGALILMEMYLWLGNGRVGGQDMVLTALELVGLWCLVLAGWRGLRGMALGWGLAVGLGLLLKSSMILLAVVAVLPYLWTQNRRHQLLQNPYLYAGLGLGLSGFGLWYWAAYQQYGEAVYTGLVGKVLNLGAHEFHPAGPFYYFWNLPVNTFPWTFFALAGLVVLVQTNGLYRYLALWSYPLVFFTLLQIYTTKTPYYLLQITPFIALLAALYLDHLMQPAMLKRSVAALRVVSLLLAVLAVLLLGAVVALTIAPQMLPEGLVYRPLALALGVLWLLPLLVLNWRRWLSQWQNLWVTFLLAGPWVALLLAVLVTNLGDYSPQFKAFTQTQWPGSASGPVDMVYEGNPERVSQMIALAFYTPQPGTDLRSGDILSGKGNSIWWLAPETRQALEAQKFPFQTIAEVNGWTLAQKSASIQPSRPPVMPTGAAPVIPAPPTQGPAGSAVPPAVQPKAS